MGLRRKVSAALAGGAVAVAVVAAPALAANIRGTNGADVLEGTSGRDYVVARQGADVIFTYRGNDGAAGQGGADRIQMGAGNDWACGGSGHDQFFGGPGNDDFFGGICHPGLENVQPHDVAYGGPGDDFLTAAFMDGGRGNDVLDLWTDYVGPGQRISAGPGDDRVDITDFGSRPTIGRDVVKCGPGEDRVRYVLSEPDPEDRLIGCETVR